MNQMFSEYDFMTSTNVTNTQKNNRESNIPQRGHGRNRSLSLKKNSMMMSSKFNISKTNVQQVSNKMDYLTSINPNTFKSSKTTTDSKMIPLVLTLRSFILESNQARRNEFG
jgi:hypothetical protein